MHWKSLIAIIVPLVLVALSLSTKSVPKKWLYVVSMMTIFWATEAIPHSITSLIPIGFFPLLGILDTDKICTSYVHETVFTLLGSVIISSSVKACNLHKRIALKILCHVKCCHRRLHFTIMATTMFISMWMQNFTVVAMMSPICLSILEQLEAQGTTTLFKAIETIDDNLQPTRITMSYLLGISYAATLGGCGSLIGAPVNLSLKGIYETYFLKPEDESTIDFPRFLGYSAPIMLVNTLLTWLWLQILYMGLLRPKSEDAVALFVSDDDAASVKENILFSYRAMGKVSAAEIKVAALVVIFHLALLFRSVRWNFYSTPKIREASPTIIIVILLFIIPSNCFDKKSADGNTTPKESESLMTWTFVRRNVPWGLIFLLGAGVALADSAEKNSTKDLNPFDKDIPTIVISFCACLLSQIVTEFASNTVTANIILPLLAIFCNESNSLAVMIPAALSINMAFHTSIGTSSNAYVVDLINIPSKEMILCGIGPSIITLLTYWSTFSTYGTIFFEQLNTTTTQNRQ